MVFINRYFYYVTILLNIMVSPGWSQTIEQDFDGITFVKIDPSTFIFGSSQEQLYHQSNERAFEISLNHSFWISKYEVTQGEWNHVMGSNPSTFQALGPELSAPVETISWYDAQNFIEKLNENAGDKYYRLPTEGEWEYVAKAGSLTAWSFGDLLEHLNQYTHRDGSFHPRSVGLKLPNPWGIHDLHGNVYEWCQDWYHSIRDPTTGACPPEQGTFKVIRGGSNACDEKYLRSSSRQFALPDRKGYYIGIRLIRVDHPTQDPYQSQNGCTISESCGDGVLNLGEQCDDHSEICLEDCTCAEGYMSDGTECIAVNEVIDQNVEQELTQTYESTRAATRQFSYEYNRAVTGINPLKGFTKNYAWGTPANDLEHSLEFIYIALSDLIDESGSYDFDSVLEVGLNEAVSRGHHSIIRVYLDYPTLESGVPLSIRNQIQCQIYDDYGGGCSPNYDDPILQSVILNFIAAFGMNYDGDQRIGFIQIGLLGFWGEWHTYPHNEWFADAMFQQNVITAFDEAFSITPIQLRIPAQDSPSREIGFHDDSFAYSTIGPVAWFFWPRMVEAMADQRWQIAPMGGEIYPPLQESIFAQSYELGEYSQDPLTSIEVTHTTYLLNYQAFHLGGHGYQGAQRTAAEQAAQAMGYEFTVQEVELELSNLTEGAVDLQVAVLLRNSGIAPFYYPLTMTLTSKASEQSWQFENNLKLLIPSDNLSTFNLKLPSLEISELTEGFTLSLTSPHLLADQKIRWANTSQENGNLSIPNNFNCEFNSATYSLSAQLMTTQGHCYCDVDGLFYTASGQNCSE